MLNNIDDELKATETKLQIETNLKEEFARQNRELQLQVIKQVNQENGNEIKDLKDQIDIKDGKIRELEQTIDKKTNKTQEKINDSLLREARLRSDNVYLQGEYVRIKEEKSKSEQENHNLKTDIGKLRGERVRFQMKAKEDLDTLKSFSQKVGNILDKSSRDDKEITDLNKNLDQTKITIDDLKKDIQTKEDQIKDQLRKIQNKDDALRTSDQLRKDLNKKLSDQGEEIRNLKENIRLLHEAKEITNDVIPTEQTRDRENQDRIKKGGFDICFYYLKGKCKKSGECIYPHPTLCFRSICDESCWKVHFKDLDTEDERWVKRGAVPYKYNLESRKRTGLCRFAQLGQCRFGNECKFKHPTPEYQQPLRRPNMPETTASPMRPETNDVIMRPGSPTDDLTRCKKNTEEIQQLVLQLGQKIEDNKKYIGELEKN